MIYFIAFPEASIIPPRPYRQLFTPFYPGIEGRTKRIESPARDQQVQGNRYPWTTSRNRTQLPPRVRSAGDTRAETRFSFKGTRGGDVRIFDEKIIDTRMTGRDGEREPERGDTGRKLGLI